MITDIEDYFTKGCGRCPRFETRDCAALLWSDGIEALRALCLAAGLSEHVKWGHPAYMHAGRNIVVIGAFRADFHLSFFEAGLMQDPAGLLKTQGKASVTAGTMRFRSAQEVILQGSVIAAYLLEAKGYAEAGIRAPKVARDVPWPDELTEALDLDPALAEAFANLTPGRQRSYLFNLNGAKKPQTRVARIAKFRDKIMAGKGAMDR